MDSYLNENLLEVLTVKHSPNEVLQKWRNFCGVVKNPKRRFRFTANLSKRGEAAAMRKSNQEKLRTAILVQKAAVQFIQGAPANDNGIHVQKEVKAAGFDICAEELESIVEGHDVKKLKFHGGVDGIARKLHTCTTNGLSSDNKLLNHRQEIFGTNKFDEAQVGSFLVFVLEALQNMALMILAVCAFVSLIVGIVMEGWPEGARDGLGIVASILLVVFVTATIDYWQALQFRDFDKEKKTSIQVIRNGYRQEMPTYDLLPGDIVHLSIGDQVPADGLFLSGFSVSIDGSSLSGESEPVLVNEGNPFLLSGTKFVDGSCKMLITTVGIRTKWGKLMATLSKGGDDEIPLQLKLNGVATFIGKTGLAFAVVTFAVLVQGLFTHKLLEGTHWSWSEDDALEMLEFLSVAVTIVVVAMKNDKALVCHLAACETMGSATSICGDKTGTLTTNLTTVVKACICMNVKDVDSENTASSFSSGIPDSAVKPLLQSLCNYSGEVVANKEGKPEILGSPTETALLEFGLFLDRDFQGKQQASKLIRVELFNSIEERMSVVLELPEGLRAHTKGASEMILAACDKVINSNGEVVPLDEATNDHLNATINQFASEALRTLCLAYMELENGFAPNDPIPLFGYTCIGIVGFKDLVRPGVKESLAISGSTGITVRMDIAGKKEAEESTDVIIRGRSVYKNIRKFVQFQLAVNVFALIVNFYLACLIGNAPLTAVQLLWVNMIMDTLGAFALPTEPPTDELMKRSPVGRRGNFIRNVMWRNIVCQSLYQFMVIWYRQVKGKALFQLNGPDSDRMLNSLIFNSFVVCQALLWKSSFFELC